MFSLLRWWFVTCTSVIGLFTAGFLGFFPYLWSADITKLSFVVLALFLMVNLFIGLLAFHARDGDQLFESHLPFCWYTTELMLGLGMMGTLVGFLILLTAAFKSGFNLADTVAMQKTLAGMAVGFGTACLTTLVGLACSLITKLQLVSLEYQLEK